MKVRAMFSEHEIMAFMNSSQNMSENIRCPNYTNELVQLLVFSVTPFKIDQNKNQNRSIDKVQNLGNERYTKTLAKIQVRGIFRVRDIRRNVFTKLIETCMETPCWCPSGRAPTWRTETRKIFLPSFATKA